MLILALILFFPIMQHWKNSAHVMMRWCFAMGPKVTKRSIFPARVCMAPILPVCHSLMNYPQNMLTQMCIHISVSVFMCGCVCMYDYHIAVAIKPLAPFERVRVCICAFVCFDTGPKMTKINTWRPNMIMHISVSVFMG